MIKVFVRHDLEEKGRMFGNFEVKDIENLVKLIKKYGTSIDVDGVNIPCKYLYSQFYIDEKDQVLFEIVVETE